MLKRAVTAVVLGLSLQTAAAEAPPRVIPSAPAQPSAALPSPPQPSPAQPRTATTAAVVSTLETVKARGTLRCGASAGLEGFGQVDAKGHWSGFDVDFCRAVAAVVFGDPDKVELVPLTTKERFDALSRGRVDLLSRDTTWTLSREASHDLLFAGITYYDGQGFLVRRDLKVTSALNLSSDTICVQADTTTELNLADFFRQRGLKYKPRIFFSSEEVEAAYASGKCAVFTSDASALFVLRANLPAPDDSIILPEIISKEPLGPAVRMGDDRWFEIVRWTVIAMVDAEEMGVTQANVDQMIKGDNPRIRRLLGAEGNFAQSLGITADWAYRIVKFVGNYNDVFQRNLGDGSKLKIKRGLNELWTHGGLLYAPPVL